MKMQNINSLAPLTQSKPQQVSGQARLLLVLAVLASLTNACEFLDKSSPPSIPKDNPGINANLPTTFPSSPNENSFRITSAQKQTQTCYVAYPCFRYDADYIAYSYDINNHLESATERKQGSGGDFVSHRHYFYTGTRLDKVAVSNSPGSNFHTLHDYTYDDENDEGYLANNSLSRPKLRKEYICDIDAADVLAASTETCGRLTAIEAIFYIYYETGFLYRKEFDVNNDNVIEHQKIYYYDETNQLIRVDTDNFYNGEINERSTYQRENNELTLLIDNKFANTDTRGTKIAISYRLDQGLGNTVNKECYYGNDEPLLCEENSRHNYHWEFTWETNPCWAGGLDDIDPEARAINYLCKEPNI